MRDLKANCAHWHGIFKGVCHLLQAPEHVFCKGVSPAHGKQAPKGDPDVLVWVRVSSGQARRGRQQTLSQVGAAPQSTHGSQDPTLWDQTRVLRVCTASTCSEAQSEVRQSQASQGEHTCGQLKFTLPEGLAPPLPQAPSAPLEPESGPRPPEGHLENPAPSRCPEPDS